MTSADEGGAIGDIAHELHSLYVDPGHGSRTDAVTEALREAILSGLVAPGRWLREEEIAAALGVSRTPMREALRRLADEGLTHRVANKGSIVAPMSIEDILAVYAVRANLEGLAARLAATHATGALVTQLRHVQHRMRGAAQEGASVSGLNLEFHRAIRDASRNAYLRRFLVQVENSVRRFGQTTFDLPDRLDEALDEHDEIIDAIEARDEDRAEAVATRHMRNAREARLRQMLTD